MAITRIKNNQITDSTVNAAAKLADFSITSGKLANGLTYGSDFTITGNLTVNGTTTTVDTNNMTVDDPVLLLGSNQTGAGAVDIGFIGERGDDTNVAFVWDESEDKFVAAFTSDTDTNGTLTVTDKADVNVGGLTADDAIVATGNVTGGNIITAGAVESASVDASGAIVGDTLEANTSATLASASITDLTSGRVVLAGTSGELEDSTNLTFDGSTLGVTGAITASTTITATGNVVGGNVTTTGQVAADNADITNGITAGTTITATGNIAGGNITTGGAVEATGLISSGSTITATGNVSGGNLTTAGDVTTATVTASGAITTGTTITATGNITGGNLITAGTFEASSITATGNVTGGNLITAGATETASLDASGAIVGDTLEANTSATLASAQISDLTSGRVVLAGTSGELEDSTNLTFDGSTLGVTGAITASTTITGTGNVTGGNLITAGAVEGASVDASGAIVGDTLEANTSATLASAAISDLTDNRVVIAGTSGELEDDANFTFDGSTVALGGAVDLTVGGDATATGNVTGGNLVTAGAVEGDSLDITNNALVGGTLTITGNLTVQGTTTTVDSTTTTLEDPVMRLGTSGLTGDDGKDRGIEFIHHDGTSNFTGFFGYDDDNEVFTFIPDATNTNEVFTGTEGNVKFHDGTFTGAISATETITATGNITGGNIISLGSFEANSLDSTTSITAGTTITATGNITGGNLITAGDVEGVNMDASGAITAGTTITATGNVSGGNITTAGDVTTATVTASQTITATGNVTGGNLTTAGDVTTATVTASGNVTGGNLITAGDVDASTGTIATLDGTTATFTGNVSGGNLVTAGDVTTATVTASGAITSDSLTATGNVAGGNLTTAGDVTTATVTASGAITSDSLTATGNVAGGNLTTAGDVTTATVTASGAITSDSLTATGNVAGGNLTTAGDVTTATVTASGAITSDSLTATGNVAGGNLTTAGDVTTATVTASGAISSSTTITATGNVSGGNLTTAGAMDSATINTTGEATLASATVSDLTDNRVVIAGTSGALEDDANFTFDGSTMTVGADASITGTADVQTQLMVGDVAANLTTGATLEVAGTDSILVPVGTTAQRPGSPVTGMIRFNTTIDSFEFYDNDSWTTAGSEFTVIASETFNGDGSTVAFTISDAQTTASCIVSINGVVQLPTTAYSVSGTTLTFTEAPLSGDVIEVRKLTTTSTVLGINNADSSAAVVVADGSDTITATGNLLPSANVTYNLGSTTTRWNELYLAGNTITMGDVVMKDTGGAIGFFGSDGTTPIPVDSSSVDATSISSGTSDVTVDSSGGPISVDVGGTNILNFTSAGITNGQADGVGNIGASGGSFNTVFAKATSAQYADLAEMYAADADIEPGTVVVFGGDAEVTTATNADDHRVAGVVSTNPSYLMNSAQEGDYVVPVAFTGRVPCKVTGTVAKGDLMVSAGEGKAKANNNPAPGTIIGKALENSEGDAVIEVVVGRF